MSDALQTAAYDETNKSLYLDGAGRRLTVEDKTFIVTIDGSEPIATIPQHHVGSVVCVGPVSLSAGTRAPTDPWNQHNLSHVESSLSRKPCADFTP